MDVNPSCPADYPPSRYRRVNGVAIRPKGRYFRAPRCLPRLLPAVLMLLLSACAYRAPVDDPVARSLTWFSYAAGDDIRAACTPQAPDRYRFVYNADYERQIRAYDLVREADGGAVLRAQARGPSGDLTRLSVSDPTAPWGMRTSTSRLDPAATTALGEALTADGALGPAPAGLRLPSYGYYWLMTGCTRGQFHINAFLHPLTPHASLVFPEILLTHDRTGVPFRPAQGTENPNLVGPPRIERDSDFDRGRDFLLQINSSGTGLVRGFPTL